ncbi:tRNA pseudouridine(55) synthase TruB [Fulvivirga sedimenti]|uniref:tRNA pseudouridine synthase B n=1 Tax=Fulvivirga sedimenti TaxID=2879465 RepID=A0A9X1HMI2_9BACT|nr:tRNA pseudouridine(55) synthase TruB [Fulvivirga sedimenti]MCA6073317.1 tRNA pseudouridine(55) synthase TruB [Fulvivirga sedimenti]
MEPEEGSVLLVDKPLTWTSFDVVKKLRYALKVKKIGHAGTLDPLATGLLILCTGKMTKQIDSFQAMEKEYEGEIVLGKITPSYDLETDVQEFGDTSGITEDQIEQALNKFRGTISQVPPQFSAIKVDGKRAYESARKGKKIKMEPRQVEIKQFDLEKISTDRYKFTVVCSKGTYIRSLAHDFGQALGTGAYLAALRRTRIGNFHVKDASTIEALTAL